MAQGNFVSYLRISTDRQAAAARGSKLNGTPARYLNGCGWKLVAEYVEVENGKRNSRPHCKQPSVTPKP
jgi:hypothetical protein